jgi:hypothetical protein
MNPKDRQVKIHQKEIEQILNLKSLVDRNETFWSYAEKYQKLGWVLQAATPQGDIDLEVDSGEDPENWIDRQGETGLTGSKIKQMLSEVGDGSKIKLEVYTGKQTGLLVLEVAKGHGELILDQYGEWRAACIAALGADREQHFYAWDPSPLFDSESCMATPEISCFGEGHVAPVPPSFDAHTQETWRWLCPPWEEAPQYPSQPLSRFLRQHLTREPQSSPEASLSWQEVYCLVSPYKTLLQALSASYPSTWNYYQGILEAAAAVGLKSPEVLLSLLWHAPRGKARQQPEIWGFLEKLVAENQDQPGAGTPPENVPWDEYLSNFLARAKKPCQSGLGQAADKPGPPCFLQRRQTKPRQPGGAQRTPFSCCKTGADLRKL